MGIMLTHSMMCHTAAVVLKRVVAEGSAMWVVLFLLAYVMICATAYYLTVVLEHFCPILLGKKSRCVSVKYRQQSAEHR